jgi:hypothetical protein
MHWVDDAEQRRQMVGGMLAWNTDVHFVYIDIAGSGLLVGEAERQGKIVVSTELGGCGQVIAPTHRIAASGHANVLRRFGVIEARCRRAPRSAARAGLLMATELDNYLLAPESASSRRSSTSARGSRRGAGRPHPTSSSAPRPRARVILSKTAGIVCVVRAIATTEQGDSVVVIAREADRSGSTDGEALQGRRHTQVDVRHTDVEHNLEIHLQLIAEAAEAGCELIVFPETSATGNNGSVEVTRLSEPHDGRIVETIRKQAKASSIIVSYGFCERFRGTHYNTCALVGPDGLIGLQRKVRLTTSSSASASVRVGRVRPRLLHRRHRHLSRQRLLRELAHPLPSRAPR